MPARSRVFLCPEKEPIAVRRLSQVQTQNTSQNIHRVQTRVHKTDMIVITHEDPEHVPTQDIRLLGPFSQEHEVKPLASISLRQEKNRPKPLESPSAAIRRRYRRNHAIGQLKVAMRAVYRCRL
jgi:hypothetical protein